MAGKAEGQGMRGGARPGAGRKKGGKNMPSIERVAMIKARIQERRGGARKGAGKKPLFNRKEVQTLKDAALSLENDYGVGIIEMALSIIYDPKASPAAKASIFKIYMDGLYRASVDDASNKDEQPKLAPVIGLPSIRRA